MGKWIVALLTLGAVAGVLSAAVGDAQAQQAGNPQKGLRLARQICSQCHLVDNVVGRSSNPDAPTFATIAQTSGLTSAALIAMLRTSHVSMPNVVLKPDETKDVVAYILSLKAHD